MPTPFQVWVVDDDEARRSAGSLIMECLNGVACDRSFRAFVTAEELLATLENASGPDVILLDLNLPGISGLDAIEPIRALSPNSSVFMWSSFCSPQQEALARTRGACAFLSKLDSTEDLATAIRAKVSGKPIH